MGLFDKFPYTNFHELNLDWIIKALKDLDHKVDNLQATITEEAKKYIDQRIQEFVEGPLKDMQADITRLESEFQQLEQDIQQQFEQFEASQDRLFQQFKQEVNDQLNIMRGEIRQAKEELTIIAKGAYEYVDQKCQLFMDMIPELVQQQSLNIKVLNFFTGKYVTIQEMFDTLALLHVQDGISYADLAARKNTYEDVKNYQRTYIDVTVYGNTIFTQKGA